MQLQCYGGVSGCGKQARQLPQIMLKGTGCLPPDFSYQENAKPLSAALPLCGFGLYSTEK